MQFSSPDYLDMRVICLGNEWKYFIYHFAVFLFIRVEVDIEDVLKSKDGNKRVYFIFFDEIVKLSQYLVAD